MINHPYKLLVIDIDGTLIGRDSIVSAENRAVLAKARELGVQVSLSTGRGIKACLNVIDQLSLDSCHISFDGALVSNHTLSREVYVKPINKAVVRQMVEFAHSHNLDLELYSASHYFAERETWSTGAHRDFFGTEPTILDFNGLWEKERIIKGGMVATTPREAVRARDFCDRFADRLHASWVRTPHYPGIDFINILSPGVSKGKALEALASYLGIALSEVIAVGDGTNDIPLLTAAGLAVAMGNASEEVKAVADHVTLDVEHNGLAAAIERFLL